MQKLVTAALVFMSLNAFGAAAVDASSILRQAEAIRNPNVSYQGIIKITDKRPGKNDDVRTYEVRSKNQATTIVEYLTPEPGTKVLMMDDDMWIALPKVAKPIRIAPKQKLVGNASYGDIASINYQESYDAELKNEDTFEGKKVYILSLRSKPNKAVTYERIEYWIDQSNSRPVKADYMTSSGKVLREGTFTGFHKVLGVERPLTLVLKDYLDRDLVTTIEFVDAKEKTFPNSLFDKNSLK